MLILTRKKSETVHIGDGISVTVIRVSGNKVRLGVSAPREMRVIRVELEGSSGSGGESLDKKDGPSESGGGLHGLVDKARRRRAA